MAASAYTATRHQASLRISTTSEDANDDDDDDNTQFADDERAQRPEPRRQ